MRKFDQPPIKIVKLFTLYFFVLLTLLACRLTTPLSSTVTVLPKETDTPTPEYCFWNWAYGEGSPAYDTAVLDQFALEGILGTVTSSSYGEIYSCDNSYHAKDLDVKLEIQVNNLEDQTILSDMAANIYSILEEKLPFSEISGLGNIMLNFISEDGSSTCYWDYYKNSCSE